MPKRAKELAAIEVKRLGEGMHAVGGVPGLCLQVNGATAKSWILRVTVGTKRREIGLGVYPEVGLANARLRAFEVKDEIRRGIDPVERRKEARAAIALDQMRGLTFTAAVELFLPVKAQELAVGKYRDQWRDSLFKYAIPTIGNMRVHDIQVSDILRILEPIWAEKYVTADKLRRKLNEILDFCTVKGYRSGPNPARWEGNLSHALSSLSGVSREENFPALQFQDLPRFWAALKLREGMGAAALMFQTLTATRAGAIRFMTWAEINVEERVWTVQPERQASKIGKKESAKRVPLTGEMVEILHRLPRHQGNDLVFWAPRGGALSDATMGKLLRAMHQADVKAGNRGFVDAKTQEIAVPHGIRSTFKNWAIERTNYEWQLSEAALWHKLGNKVESSYARSDMLEKRRKLMADWGSFVRGAGSRSFE
jgi:integrase